MTAAGANIADANQIAQRGFDIDIRFQVADISDQPA